MHCKGSLLLSAAGSTWGPSQRCSGCWRIFNAAQMAGGYTAFFQITVLPFWVKLKADKFNKEVFKSELILLLLPVKLWIITQAQWSCSDFSVVRTFNVTGHYFTSCLVAWDWAGKRLRNTELVLSQWDGSMTLLCTDKHTAHCPPFA